MLEIYIYEWFDSNMIIDDMSNKFYYDTKIV